jgi:hypothetical protein
VNHGLCRRIKHLFAAEGVTCFSDPFHKGDIIDVRIQTLEYDALLFLACGESLASKACQFELDSASSRFIPIFTVRLSRDVLPTQLKLRIWVDLTGATVNDVFCQPMKELAKAIRDRGALYRKIMSLAPENGPQDTRAAAQAIATKFSPVVVGEFLDLLDSRYRPETDVETRFWIAMALGQSGRPEAAQKLKAFVWDDHPRCRDGIRQALEMIRTRGGGRASAAEDEPSQSRPGF